MTAPFCTDCGTGCTTLYGRDADPGERDIADALVWSCPVCPASWCRHDPIADQPIGTPAGPDTRNARAILIERQVERLIAEALDASPNGRAIAEERIAGFIASHLGLDRDDGAIDRLGLEQCRAAWKALARASYDDVARWARQYRGVKGRVAA